MLKFFKTAHFSLKNDGSFKNNHSNFKLPFLLSVTQVLAERSFVELVLASQADQLIMPLRMSNWAAPDGGFTSIKITYCQKNRPLFEK